MWEPLDSNSGKSIRTFCNFQRRPSFMNSISPLWCADKSALSELLAHLKVRGYGRVLTLVTCSRDAVKGSVHPVSIIAVKHFVSHLQRSETLYQIHVSRLWSLACLGVVPHHHPLLPRRPQCQTHLLAQRLQILSLRVAKLSFFLKILSVWHFARLTLNLEIRLTFVLPGYTRQ